ncbi:MAG: ABC-F family ATP-binding cassette domain-containing protein [Bdellovibrionales bacterium]|nr:ABC-F family ATP-binding cassette domain-containing protein [Bdellovibrionales bacterium]
MILAAAHGLAKNFAGRTLFENVSFGIESGERVGLVGPNGAGKSTLLRLLSGTVTPDDGTVARKKGLRLGFLEQTPVFSPGLTLPDAVLEKADDKHESLPRALEMMARLELNRFTEDFPVANLSGGWAKRVALARELVREPELLMLDEPTNHLDVSSILWLEKFLAAAPFAILMITHDRLFLQRVASRILDLDPRNPGYLLNISGGYLQYVEAKEHELMALQRQERVLSNTLRREKEWLARGSLARQTKQSARIQGAADLSDEVDRLREKNRDQRVDLNFGAAAHSPHKLVEAVGVAKAYDGEPLFSNLDLLVTPKTRLALLGDNGSGKSTLVRLLLGLEQPTTGQVKRAEGLTVSYFEQGRETLDFTKSVLKNICPEGDYVNVHGQYVHIRSYLDRFLFKGNKAEQPAGKLSGGEQARLRLAQLMLIPAQILVLDEPTNDLDAETLQVLEESLAEFSGAVIIVTHDRYFMDAVANQILAFPPAAHRDQGLQKFASYFQWETWFSSLNQPSAKTTASAAKKDAPTRVKLSYKDKFELENMESTILSLEEEIAKLSTESQSPAVISDHARLAELHGTLAEKQALLESKYERWAELEAMSKGQSGPQ